MVAPAANASGNEKPPASSSADTSVDAAAAEAKDAPASSAWSWGSPEDTASSGSNDTGSAKADSDAEGRTGSTPTETTTSPSWSWSSSTNGADDADHAAADHDRSHEDAAIVDASEQGNQNADSPAETETSVDSGSTSPLANITSSTNDSATDTASTSTWSWGESHSEPEQDISGASGVESSGATSDVTDSDANTDVNAEEIAVLSTPVPDTAEEEALSTTSEGSAAGSNSSGDRSSSDVDVSSAFTDDTDTEGEGEETLSSWAARWNDAEADAASPDTGSTDTIGATTTTSATNESDPAATTADSQVDFTEQSPLEGAPGGQQSSSDGSTANTEPADTTGYGIEGAPGGQLPEDDTTTTDTESWTNPDVSVPPAHEREEAYRDQTSAADDIGSAGDERAITATDDLVDDEGTTAAANEPIDEPSGAHGSEVTPGTDSDLVDPLAGMEVSPTSTITATGQDSGSTGATSTESARNRAEQLIDELRDLLPSLTASGSDATDSSAGIAAGAGSDQDLQPVIDELTAARPQAGSFDDLRTALEKARTNPRDVDTMLDLVGRVDDLIALLDSQDRLNTAAGHAIDQLHQSGTHPEN